jgi:hypothetical protein
METNFRRILHLMFWANVITVEIYLFCRLVHELFFHLRL